MAHQHYRKRRMAEMNVVPYIDVMLVLLIIFMITSPLLTEGVHVELPKVKIGTKPISSQKGSIVVVTVNAKGEIFLQDDDQPISREELVEQVHTLTSAVEDSQVFVKGDKNIVYGKIIEMMALLKSAGIERVSLVTQR